MGLEMIPIEVARIKKKVFTKFIKIAYLQNLKNGSGYRFETLGSIEGRLGKENSPFALEGERKEQNFCTTGLFITKNRFTVM